jgi:xanthine dehydrogenase accessory factor
VNSAFDFRPSSFGPERRPIANRRSPPTVERRTPNADRRSPIAGNMFPMSDFFDRLAALRREGQSFAVATVVARRSPVSAHLGDRAVVFPDGRMEGFVGGACSCEIVRQEALEALRTRRARLISIRPDADERTDPAGEHIVVAMRCASEGAVDVFVEPFVLARRLVVVGATPVADALVRVARSLDYEVVWSVEARDRHAVEPRAAALGARVLALEDLETALRIDDADLAAVVASQANDDDRALETILKAGVPYVGLVASRKRGSVVRAALTERGVAGVEAIHSPAGLDFGARVPAEVALSVLAEIVKQAPSQAPAHGTTCGADRGAASDAPAEAVVAPQPASSSSPIAVDPVCGMKVDVATARHTAAVDGTTYYFCGPHCRMQFIESSERYSVS